MTHKKAHGHHENTDRGYRLLASITSLSLKKQLAFALLVFERMLPSLTAFSKDTGFDDSCYLQGKDAAWAALRDGDIEPSLNEACLRGAPDTENFSHELTSYALNAALAMSDILEFILDGRAQHIAYILTLATDSVDFYVGALDPSAVYTPELERRIAAHPLMRQEMCRQEEDIKFLSNLPDQFDEAAISALRARANNQAPLLPLSR